MRQITLVIACPAKNDKETKTIVFCIASLIGFLLLLLLHLFLVIVSIDANFVMKLQNLFVVVPYHGPNNVFATHKVCGG